MRFDSTNFLCSLSASGRVGCLWKSTALKTTENTSRSNPGLLLPLVSNADKHQQTRDRMEAGTQGVNTKPHKEGQACPDEQLFFMASHARP